MNNVLLISPSKTMQEAPSKEQSSHVFPSKKDRLLSILKKTSKENLKAMLDISDSLTERVAAMYHDFTETNVAIKAYQGVQYKAIDVGSMDKESLAFLQEHLFIMSGLYGLVRPLDTVGLYRLPMAVKLESEPLHHYWRAPLKDTLKGKTLLNLASKEYALALDPSLDVIEIKFDKAPSHTVKTLRGLMVKYLAFKQSTALDTVKTFYALDYHYNDDASSEKIIVFSK
ncbi:MAG: YaaA family protein [Bacillota bacterium]